jgi:hypothetical protein
MMSNFQIIDTIHMSWGDFYTLDELDGDDDDFEEIEIESVDVLELPHVE